MLWQLKSYDNSKEVKRQTCFLRIFISFFFENPGPYYHHTHLIILQIPAFDLFVLARREQVRLSGTDGQAADSADVARQREFERARGQVPDLDDAISSARHEPFIARLHSYTTHPAQVTTDHLYKKTATLVICTNKQSH